jgi:hypothetical protein
MGSLDLVTPVSPLGRGKRLTMGELIISGSGGWYGRAAKHRRHVWSLVAPAIGAPSACSDRVGKTAASRSRSSPLPKTHLRANGPRAHALARFVTEEFLLALIPDKAHDPCSRRRRGLAPGFLSRTGPSSPGRSAEAAPGYRADFHASGNVWRTFGGVPDRSYQEYRPSWRVVLGSA